MLWIGSHTLLDNCDQHLAVSALSFFKRLIVTIHDLLRHCERVPCTEWLCEGNQLVDYAAKRPNVCLLCVGLRLHNLRT